MCMRKQHAADPGSPALLPTQVKRLVCRECGKTCRSETEWDVHSKRTGHQAFDDKVGGWCQGWQALL